jgi:DNA polymerase
VTSSRSTRAARLRAVEAQAARCTRCELYENATQTVFGAGRATARLMLVGEQPGDREDRMGAPFGGPAGSVLDRALGELGVDRRTVYLTNVVKHFRFEQSGKRRIHKTPSVEHVRICLPWFEQELAIVQPEVVVCLGAVASKALLGPTFKLIANRGAFVSWDRPGRVLATVHPSSVLRSDDRDAAYAAFLADLAVAVAAAPPVSASP